MVSVSARSDLSSLRREIDDIDTDIMALFRRRFSLMSDVRAAKLDLGLDDGPVLHIARENEVLSRLLSLRGDIPASVVISLWRQLIGSSSLLQADSLSAHIISELDRFTALLHFGVDIPIIMHSDFGHLFSTVSVSANRIGFLPVSDCWLADFISVIQSGCPLCIFSRAPLLSIGGVRDVFLFSSLDCDLSPDVDCGRLLSVFQASILADMEADEGYSSIMHVWGGGGDLVLAAGSCEGNRFSDLSKHWGGISVGCYHDMSCLESVRR